ncbi:MAG: hypothetical protein KDN22_16050 [Verrucomicrobiae bacterium]|nr:hypothetical protein [Verrucomicrobiae bacterium]
MFVLGFVVAGLGVYSVFVGGIWFLAKAFGVGVGWGLASLVIPFAGLVFAIKYWGISWRPLALNVVGGVSAVGGAALLLMSVASETGGNLAAGLPGLEQSGANTLPAPAADTAQP